MLLEEPNANAELCRTRNGPKTIYAIHAILTSRMGSNSECASWNSVRILRFPFLHARISVASPTSVTNHKTTILWLSTAFWHKQTEERRTAGNKASWSAYAQCAWSTPWPISVSPCSNRKRSILGICKFARSKGFLNEIFQRAAFSIVKKCRKILESKKGWKRVLAAIRIWHGEMWKSEMTCCFLAPNIRLSAATNSPKCVICAKTNNRQFVLQKFLKKEGIPVADQNECLPIDAWTATRQFGKRHFGRRGRFGEWKLTEARTKYPSYCTKKNSK